MIFETCSKPDVETHAHNPSTVETEAERAQGKAS
jgi:hypothetical protein